MSLMNDNLRDSILELIRKTSCEMPKDVLEAIHAATKNEKTGSRGRYAMDIICENIKMAAKKSQPICQDTGSILFFVEAPVGFNRLEFEDAAKKLYRTNLLNFDCNGSVFNIPLYAMYRFPRFESNAVNQLG